MPAISSGGAEMDRSFRSGLVVLLGVALLAMALAIQAILLETVVWTALLAGAGALLTAWGAVALRTELGAMIRGRRCFFFQAEDGIRDLTVTGVQTCALPI